MVDDVYIGIRCGNPIPLSGSWAAQDTPCSFRLRYVVTPQYMSKGDYIGPLPLGQGMAVSYAVDVGSYDVYSLLFTRLGDNLTYSCSGYGASCETNGHGLVATVRTGRMYCPTPGRAYSTGLLGNTTRTLAQEWFCTTPAVAGRYYVTLQTDTIFDPAGAVPGWVMPDGSKPTSSNLVPLPGGAPNRLKPARGYYSVEVRHDTFVGGALSAGVPRIGCIAHSQWRHFTLVTSGLHDATIYASVQGVNSRGEVTGSMPVSALYIRRNKRPTSKLYDGRVAYPADSISSSPCDAAEAYQYHIGLYLSYPLRASADGLGPTYFELTARLMSADGAHYGTASWPAIGEEHTSTMVYPLSLGGTGHVCCGQFRYWMLRDVPADVEPIVTVVAYEPAASTAQPSWQDHHAAHQDWHAIRDNGTAHPGGADRPVVTTPPGLVQGVFVKRLTCPTRADVDQASALGCTGRCAVSWLVRYDTHSGASTHTTSAVARPGFAPFLQETGRADWYIGVQALRDAPAQFSLLLSSRMRAVRERDFDCGRFNHFCPQQPLEVHNVTLNAGAGAATSAAARGAHGPLGLLLAVCCGWVLAARGRGAPWAWSGPRRRARAVL